MYRQVDTNDHNIHMVHHITVFKWLCEWKTKPSGLFAKRQRQTSKHLDAFILVATCS